MNTSTLSPPSSATDAVPSPSDAPQSASVSTPATWLRQGGDLLPPVLAGLVAVVVSYAGPFLLVLQAAQAARLDASQLQAWVWSLSVGAGLCGLWLSWRHRLPVICAWNTPGAALLASVLVALPWAEAVGAYALSALALVLLGRSAAFERWVARIPMSLCAALLAGILWRFGVQVYGQLGPASAADQAGVALLFGVYLLGRRYKPRYAIVWTLAVGLVASRLMGWSAHSPAEVHLGPTGLTWWPAWTAPAFSWAGVLGVALPLAVLNLTGQQLPGLAVLRTAGYEPPTRALLGTTAWASLALAPWGAHGINLAAITAALCAGDEAHPDPRRRWVAGVACGGFYLLVAVSAAGLLQVLMALPPVLVATVAGLALLGAIQNGLTQALAQASDREAALVTLVVTASNITVLGLGSAAWGLLLGGLTLWALRVRRAG